MSNILQVTDPSTYIDNRNVHTGQEQQSALNSSQIQNPSDPSRVVRADGQKSGTAGDQENESGFSIIMEIILTFFRSWGRKMK